MREWSHQSSSRGSQSRNMDIAGQCSLPLVLSLVARGSRMLLLMQELVAPADRATAIRCQPVAARAAAVDDAVVLLPRFCWVVAGRRWQWFGQD